MTHGISAFLSKNNKTPGNQSADVFHSPASENATELDASVTSAPKAVQSKKGVNLNPKNTKATTSSSKAKTSKESVVKTTPGINEKLEKSYTKAYEKLAAIKEIYNHVNYHFTEGRARATGTRRKSDRVVTIYEDLSRLIANDDRMSAIKNNQRDQDLG